MSSFAADIRHWPTLAEFEAHLAAHDPAIATWCDQVVYHHTYRPLRHQWHGRRTMDGLITYYRDTQGWPSGPHLFIAPDGIWQLTPLNLPGTHAMAGNSRSWGIEVVGDYDIEEWPKPIAELALGAGAALLRWRGLPATRETVSPHSAYNPKKTCPGKEIDLDWVRRELARRLTPPSPVIDVTLGDYTADSAILGAPRGDAARWVAVLSMRSTVAGYTPESVATIVGEYEQLGGLLGVDWFLALAQVAHETGRLTSWWCARPRRNPAGLGVTGTVKQTVRRPGLARAWAPDGELWREGLSFQAWRDADAKDGEGSISHHLGRLLAYALPAGGGSELQQRYINRALALRPLAPTLRGIAPTLRDLNGRWAYPGKTYAQMLARTANTVRKATA